MNHALHDQFTALLSAAGHSPRDATLLAREALNDLPKLLTHAGVREDLERWRNEGGHGYDPSPFEVALQNADYVEAAQIAQSALHPALHELLILIARDTRDDVTTSAWRALLTSRGLEQPPRNLRMEAS